MSAAHIAFAAIVSMTAMVLAVLAFSGTFDGDGLSDTEALGVKVSRICEPHGGILELELHSERTLEYICADGYGGLTE